MTQMTSESPLTRTSAAALSWPEQRTVRKLRETALATSTCPQCARRPAEVSSTVRTSGKLARPGWLAGLTAASSLLVVSLLAAFPFLLLYARMTRRGRELKVRLCGVCHARATRRERLERYAEGFLAWGPLVSLLTVAYVIKEEGAPVPVWSALLVAFTLHALALLGEVALVRGRRRRLPFVLADVPGGWRVELPASWTAVLSRELPESLEEERASASQ